MHQRFEFDAPKTYNFLTFPKSRDPNDYAIDLTDPNDYWFMITHVEVSPLKEGADEENEDEGGEREREREREDKPVVRKEIEKKVEEEVKKVHGSEVIANMAPTRPILKISRKTELPNRVHRFVAAPERQRKTVANDSLPHPDRLHNKSKEPVQRPKPSQHQPQEKVDDSPKKESLIEHVNEPVKERKPTNKSLGNTAKSAKSKDHNFSRPCPFPTRIQREWQRREKKVWHSLSPSAKCQAEKSMAQIKQEKQARDGKEVPERKKEKKSSRFRF